MYAFVWGENHLLTSVSSRQRRIKCDEKRPACTQCTRSNRTCTGYPPPSRSARPFEELRIAPKPLLASSDQQMQRPAPIREIVLPPRRARHRAQRTSSPRTPTIHVPSPMLSPQPSLGLNLTPSEMMYFDIFRTQTATELSGFFDSGFWSRRVLQECHSEAAIRHAAVALGALYKTLGQRSESLPRKSPNQGPQSDNIEHWQMAIKQYSDACNAMVLIDGRGQRSHQIIIMASILLACFDSFIGDHKQAIIQVQTGLGLMEGLRERQSQHLQTLSDDGLDEELATMFTRLAIQAKTYDMAFHFPQPYVVLLRSYSPCSPASSSHGSPRSDGSWLMPEGFSSLSEARAASDRITEMTLRFVDGMFSATQDGKGLLPPSWAKHSLEYKAQLDAWSEAFEPILHSRSSPTFTVREKAGIAALKMFHVCTQILVTMVFSSSEDDYDAFLPHFETIVDLGQEVVVDEERRAAATQCPNLDKCTHRPSHRIQDSRGSHISVAHIKPSFSADLGIVPPLFIVATKCRVPTTRRRAIQLLRSCARREGMWDSELLAHISTWVMNLEESHDQPLDPRLEPSVTVPSASVVDPIFSANPSFDYGSSATSQQSESTTAVVPSERRVRIQTVTFDLRARYADVEVGTRGISLGMPDDRYRQTRITW